MSQVDAVRTPSTASAILRALLDAGAPSSGVYMLAAQSALETAGWSAMWGFNLGNITAGDPNAQAWAYLPGNPLRFRMYDSLDEGASDFVSFLRARGLLPYAAAGDLAGYVARLQAVNYAGSDPSVYPGYEQGMRGWMLRLGGSVPSPSFGVAGAALALGGGALVAKFVHDGGARALRRWLRRWL